MTTASITIAQEPGRPDLLHVTGPRLAGTVIVTPGLHTDRWHDGGHREATVGTVTVTIIGQTGLLINGVDYRGNETLRAVGNAARKARRTQRRREAQAWQRAARNEG